MAALMVGSHGNGVLEKGSLMSHALFRTVAAVTAASLALAGCTQLSPSEPGPFSGASGAQAASQITRATNSTTGESLATGASANVAAFATMAIIAKHQATEKQRQVVIKRAKATVARLTEQAKRPEAPAKAKKVPRYIAVDTVREKNTAPQAQKVVAVWDTVTQEIVGNNVYDVGNPPAVGALSRFETYTAEYVGAGL